MKWQHLATSLKNKWSRKEGTNKLFLLLKGKNLQELKKYFSKKLLKWPQKEA